MKAVDIASYSINAKLARAIGKVPYKAFGSHSSNLARF